ncbi:MAG TPA: hypothetical protein VGG10_10465 [Rhizomicrobium sp.]|jgi:hypothetical protein
MTNDPFEVLLLEQAKLCHAELQNGLRTLREYEATEPLRKRLNRGSLQANDLFVQHVNQMIDGTTRLAAAAAKLRARKSRFNSDTKLRGPESAKKGK